MSSNSLNINLNLNNFLKDFSSKKQYIKKLKSHANSLSLIKQQNYRLLDNQFSSVQLKGLFTDHIVMYIIDITFSRSNTFLHVMDSAGHLKFFASAGHFKHKGKNKKFRFNVLKNIYRVLVTRLDYLKGKPIALHLKNVGFNKFWIIKKLKTKFFIKTIKSFTLFPFNGCRNKKVRRKK